MLLLPLVDQLLYYQEAFLLADLLELGHCLKETDKHISDTTGKNELQEAINIFEDI